MKVFNQKRLAIGLVILGALPFLVLVAMLALQAGQQWMPYPPALVLHVYAVVIGSFVAGMQWGIHFCKRTGDSVYLCSSCIALLLWGSLLAAGGPVGLAFVLLGFLLLWVQEFRFSQQRVTTAWFWQLRNWASAVVSLCLLLAVLLTGALVS